MHQLHHHVYLLGLARLTDPSRSTEFPWQACCTFPLRLSLQPREYLGSTLVCSCLWPSVDLDPTKQDDSEMQTRKPADPEVCFLMCYFGVLRGVNLHDRVFCKVQGTL